MIPLTSPPHSLWPKSMFSSVIWWLLLNQTHSDTMDRHISFVTANSYLSRSSPFPGMSAHWPGTHHALHWWRGFWLVSAPRRCCPGSGGHAGRSGRCCQTSLPSSGRCRWSSAWPWRSVVWGRSAELHVQGSHPCHRRRTGQHRHIGIKATILNENLSLYL